VDLNVEMAIRSAYPNVAPPDLVAGRPDLNSSNLPRLIGKLYSCLYNWYWSRRLTPTCNDTHRWQGASAVFIRLSVGILHLSDPIPVAANTCRNVDHCRALAGKRVAVPRKGMFHCDGAARKHAYHRSMGLFTPSPPRFSTCVYIIVVLTSAWPRSSWTVRMS